MVPCSSQDLPASSNRDPSAPLSNDDFEAVKTTIAELEPGHVCYQIPNAPPEVEAGSNATIQIRYTADFETDRNETYFACADIYYVPINRFTSPVPCFNVSSEDFATPKNEDDDSDEPVSLIISSSLSGGAIAGIVIAIFGVLVAIGAFFFSWGRRKKREVQRKQEDNVRAVQWKHDEASPGSGSKHDHRNIALRDM